MATEAASPDPLEALQWIVANYANQDLSHKDFRVEAAHRAEAALAAERPATADTPKITNE